MRHPQRNLPSLFALTGLAALVGLQACAEPAPQPEAAPQPDPAVVTTVAAAVDPAQLLPNGAEPFPGIITGGQPSLEQLDDARAAGIKTVINLRTPGESEIGQADVEARGMTYVAVPIDRDGLTEENAIAFATALEGAERPTVVHCGSGNRVGALFALKAYYLEGADLEAAVALGKTAGLTRMEASVREHFDSAPPD